MIPTNTHTYLELPSTHRYPRTSQKSENIWVDLCLDLTLCSLKAPVAFYQLVNKSRLHDLLDVMHS